MNAQPVTSHETGVRPTLLALIDARENLRRAEQSFEIALERVYPIGRETRVRLNYRQKNPSPARVVKHDGRNRRTLVTLLRTGRNKWIDPRYIVS